MCAVGRVGGGKDPIGVSVEHGNLRLGRMDLLENPDRGCVAERRKCGIRENIEDDSLGAGYVAILQVRGRSLCEQPRLGPQRLPILYWASRAELNDMRVAASSATAKLAAIATPAAWRATNLRKR